MNGVPNGENISSILGRTFLENDFIVTSENYLFTLFADNILLLKIGKENFVLNVLSSSHKISPDLVYIYIFIHTRVIYYLC